MLKFNEKQCELISNLFIDIVKILIGSVVVGFFIPDLIGKISINNFIYACISIAIFLVSSILLLKNKKHV